VLLLSFLFTQVSEGTLNWELILTRQVLSYTERRTSRRVSLSFIFKKNTTSTSREMNQGQRIILMQILIQRLLSSTMSGGFVSPHQMCLGMIAVDSKTDVLAWRILLF